MATKYPADSTGGRKDAHNHGHVRENKHAGGVPRPDRRMAALPPGERSPAAQTTGRVQGMAALADRQTGKTLGVAFWESDEALRASEEATNSLREESAEA